MRDYARETEERVAFIRRVMADAHANALVFANSGGKDCALVGILCKMACENTLSIMMPCHSKRNYGEDLADAVALCEQFGIEHITVDLTAVRDAMMTAIGASQEVTPEAASNIAPRLRMTVDYAVAQSRGALVAGTGNRSETYVGYFTKWGDGAYDFNPIYDLTVTEVYEFLDYLGAPENIRRKAPSAGLYEGQTDEGQLGVTYRQIDDVILTGKTADPEAQAKIERYHRVTGHKRKDPPRYGA
ncbi:MAG: NAD(+) synthase [Clostridiaceae bacterium]|nr:NAD(+) synthase [Clostridiaceae bacterium]